MKMSSSKFGNAISNWKVTITLVVVAVLGLSFQLWLHDYLEPISANWIFKLSDEISKAFIIASVIGIVVDSTIKLELAKDVFEASIGYLLPDELKPALKWIYDQKIICIESDYTYKLENNGNYVKMTVSIRKRYKNFGNRSAVFKYGFAIDDGCIDELKGKMTGFGYCTTEGTEFKQLEEDFKERTTDIKRKEIKIGRDEAVDAWASFLIGKYCCDQEHVVSSYPSVNPVVNVDAGSDIEYKVEFAYGVEDENAVKSLGSGKYRLYGTLLPMQHIKVSWKTKL